jgi:hypothetical protein
MHLVIYGGSFTNQRGEKVAEQRVQSFRWGQ